METKKNDPRESVALIPPHLLQYQEPQPKEYLTKETSFEMKNMSQTPIPSQPQVQIPIQAPGQSQYLYPPPSQYYSVPPAAIMGTPIVNNQHNVYPLIYSSNKPIALQGIPISMPEDPLERPENKGICKKVCESFSTGSNDFQVFDLTDESDPILMKCARCNYEGYSEVKNTPGPCTYVTMIALCCVCCICGVIPCCCKKCQYIQHYCPNCHQKIGTSHPEF